MANPGQDWIDCGVSILKLVWHMIPLSLVQGKAFVWDVNRELDFLLPVAPSESS